MLVQFPKGLVPDPGSDWGLFSLMQAANNYSQNPLTIDTLDQAVFLTPAQVVGNGMLILQGATAGPSVYTLPTAVLLIDKMRGPLNIPLDGSYSEPLRIINQQAWTVTLTGNTGLVLDGSMTIAPNAYRDFMLTILDQFTVLVQNVGAGFANNGIFSIVGTPNQIIVTEFNGVYTLSTPQDIGPGSTPQFGGLTLQGNLNFFGNARRIMGDMSNVVPINRLSFQNSTVNDGSILEIIPNGTGNFSALNLRSDSANAAATRLTLLNNGTVVQVRSDTDGAPLLPLTFFMGATEAGRITTAALWGIGINAPLSKLHLSTNASNTAPAVLAGTVLQIEGTDASAARITLDAFGSTPVLSMRRSNGTMAAPSAALIDQALMQLDGYGYGATGYSSIARAIFNIVAAENWTDAAQGTYFSWANTAPGGTTRTEKMRLNGDGFVLVGLTAPTLGGLAAAGQIVLEVRGTTARGVLAVSGGAADADATVQGSVNFYDKNNLDADNRIGFINGVTDGATANHRGGAIIFGTKQNNINGTAERMRLSNIGNLVVTTATTNAGLSITDGTVTSILFNTSSNSASIGTTSNHPVNIFTNNSGKVTITTAGLVGIGITPAASQLLQVHTATNRNISITDSVQLAGSCVLQAINDNGSANIPLELRGTQLAYFGAGTQYFSIDTVGNITGLGICVVKAKAALTARNSTTTLADDPDLSGLQLAANASYWIVLNINFFATTTAGMGYKFQVNYTGTFADGIGSVAGGGLFVGTNNLVINSPYTNANAPTASSVSVTFSFGLRTVNAGTLSFQWAQNSSSGNNLTINAGSNMTVMRCS